MTPRAANLHTLNLNRRVVKFGNLLFTGQQAAKVAVLAIPFAEGASAVIAAVVKDCFAAPIRAAMLLAVLNCFK